MTDAASVRAKTWGPFNGRQLTVIIVALVTVVFFPSAAWAVDTFSNVAIQDPVNGAKAAVGSDRRLAVSGLVSGTVNAMPRPPATPWNASVYVNTAPVPLAGPRTEIDLTSISIGTKGTFVGAHLIAYSVPLSATTCTTDVWVGVVYMMVGNPSTVATSASFPTPLVVRAPAGRKVCLYAYNSGDSVALNASGYYGV